jgi:hypothetical protein
MGHGTWSNARFTFYWTKIERNRMNSAPDWNILLEAGKVLVFLERKFYVQCLQAVRLSVTSLVRNTADRLLVKNFRLFNPSDNLKQSHCTWKKQRSKLWFYNCFIILLNSLEIFSFLWLPHLTYRSNKMWHRQCGIFCRECQDIFSFLTYSEQLWGPTNILVGYNWPLTRG